MLTKEILPCQLEQRKLLYIESDRWYFHSRIAYKLTGRGSLGFQRHFFFSTLPGDFWLVDFNEELVECAMGREGK